MMKKINPHKPITKQKGAVVLLVSIVLLIGVTLITVFAARVGVMDQRISANEYRHKESQAAASAALDQGAAFVSQNLDLYEGTAASWTSCTPIQSTFPCTISGQTYEKVYSSLSGPIINPLSYTSDLSSGVSSDTYILFTTSASAGNVLTVVGKGSSLDGSADSIAQISYAQVSLLTPGEIPPIMAPSLKLNGNFTIVANPNTGLDGSGVPISGWVEHWPVTAATGTWQTCHLGDFRDGTTVCADEYDSTDNWSGCKCEEDLSNATIANADASIDIYEQTTDFPDPFSFIFNNSSPGDVEDDIKINGKHYVDDCPANLGTLDLSALKKPWVWVKGDCTVPSVGTQDVPVLLVVEGRMTLNANTNVWGLLVSLSDVKSTGAAIVHGALVADNTADITAGGYKQVYDPSALDRLQGPSINTDLSKIKYSWIDF